MIGSKTTPTLDERIAEAHARLGVGPKRRRNAQPEHDLQAALIAQVRVWDNKAGPLVRKVKRGKIVLAPAGAWQPGPLGMLYPELMDLYAVPNGGARSKATAARLKMEGVLPGVLDLGLDLSRSGAVLDTLNARYRPLFHGLRVETKVPGAYPTPEQAAFMARLVERGYAVAVWRTLDAGVDLLTRYARGRWTQTPELLK
jgi:hypothetical protein